MSLSHRLLFFDSMVLILKKKIGDLLPNRSRTWRSTLSLSNGFFKKINYTFFVFVIFVSFDLLLLFSWFLLSFFIFCLLFVALLLIWMKFVSAIAWLESIQILPKLLSCWFIQVIYQRKHPLKLKTSFFTGGKLKP